MSGPAHLRRGVEGEEAAKRHLQSLGMKCLASNYRSKRGEIDLIFTDADCLVFVEVKTRSDVSWTRPAAAVNARKRRLISQTAFDYLQRIDHPRVKLRFDVVEVIMEDDVVVEIRHLPNTFALTAPMRYG
jgi:putative endonuclease